MTKKRLLTRADGPLLTLSSHDLDLSIFNLDQSNRRGCHLHRSLWTVAGELEEKNAVGGGNGFRPPLKTPG